jgi:beta-lactamase superfamily II metal-dependent hydrolase
MTLQGIEIDMLSLGDSDSILVTGWSSLGPTRVLIDGGNPTCGQAILDFLQSHGISRINHLVCTHPHDDHAGGLQVVAFCNWLTIDNAWIHQPRRHLDLLPQLRIPTFASTPRKPCQLPQTFNTAETLTAILSMRGVRVYEPFYGRRIGPLVVVSPTQDHYRYLLALATDAESVADARKRYERQQLFDRLDQFSGNDGHRATLLADPETSPENETSVVLYGECLGRNYLFTGDVGVEGLSNVAALGIHGLDWMQLPHHGARRNINQTLIHHFRPRVAFVSAKGGRDRKHPRPAVINEFKRVGTRVYSTHYPEPAHLLHSFGATPPRLGYGPASPLWEHVPTSSLRGLGAIA